MFYTASLGFEGSVGIKLGGSSLNIDGGLTGLIFPQTMVNSKLAGQCRLHTTASGDSGILSFGIAILQLSFSTGSPGKQWLYSHLQNYHYSVLHNISPILIVHYKLRCIASNSTEELIHLILFIYLQVTYLHIFTHISGGSQ